MTVVTVETVVTVVAVVTEVTVVIVVTSVADLGFHEGGGFIRSGVLACPRKNFANHAHFRPKPTPFYQSFYFCVTCIHNQPEKAYETQ